MRRICPACGVPPVTVRIRSSRIFVRLATNMVTGGSIDGLFEQRCVRTEQVIQGERKWHKITIRI